MKISKLSGHLQRISLHNSDSKTTNRGYEEKFLDDEDNDSDWDEFGNEGDDDDDKKEPPRQEQHIGEIDVL
jgi:hypothetical protein